MDCQEFMRKRNSSSSSSDQDQPFFVDDLPKTLKIVHQPQLQNYPENNQGHVVIVYNNQETKSQTIISQNHSQSQKSSKFSSQSRPSIYDEVEREEINYNERQRYYARNHNSYKDNRPQIPYFNPQKRQNQYQRNQYFQQQNGFKNYHPQHQYHNQNNQNQRRNNYQHNRWKNNGYQNRQHQNNFYQERNFYQRNHYQRDFNQHQRNQDHYNRENNYQRQNQRYQENYLTEKKQKLQTNNYYNYQENIQRKKHCNNDHRKEQQKIILKNEKQKQKNQQPKKITEVQVLKSKQNKNQQKNLNQRPSVNSMSQQKDEKIQKQKQVKKANKHQKIAEQSLELSNSQNQINKAQRNIVKDQSSQINKFQEKQDSDWDVSSQDSQKGYKINQQSEQYHEIELQDFLSPPIPNFPQDLSNFEEDSMLQEFTSQSQKKIQEIIPHNSKPISKEQLNQISLRAPSNVNDQNDDLSFSEKQFKTLSQMFQILPENQRQIFIELKIKTSNVANFKIKNISSEMFNLKSTLTQEIKNHPFITIINNEKSVPRDILPPSMNQHSTFSNKNENEDSKISKFLLARIKYPLNLLQYKANFVSPQQQQICKKIEKNKKKLEDVHQLISVDYITLRCHSCYNKKTFLFNNSIIPHQCKADCPNFLRFGIQSMYICEN